MSTPEAPTQPAHKRPSLWQRSVWPLMLFVALPIFVVNLIADEWLALEGRLGVIVDFGRFAAIGVTVMLILDKVRELRRQRHEAGAAAEP